MKKNWNRIILVFSVLLVTFFMACQNSFLADATKQYKVTFETNGGSSIDSYRSGKIETSPETTKTGYVFDGWYTNSSLEGDLITFPYELKEDTTFYAKWIEKGSILTFNFEDCESNADFINRCKEYGYKNGVLELNSDKELFVFKGSDSQSIVFNDLCIIMAKPNRKLVFENFSFSSSKSSSLIKSSFDIMIEYKGTNKISSSSHDKVSLIKSLGLITFKGTDNNSSFEIQPNAVTSSKEGSIGVEANKVIIDGGNFVIQGSNGVDYSENDTSGTSGRNGSSGIRATETIIQNKASVAITGGNGGKGSQGIKGDDGCSGSTRDSVAEGNAENGTNGVQGGIGGTGGKGGSAILGNFEVKSGCNVILVGGNGGTGGKGGTGGTGGKGGDNVAWGGGTGNGGTGGKGGTGGTGGNGGDAVSGAFYQENYNDNVYLKFGSKGVGGAGGNGGIGGLKGNANYVVPPFPECGDGGTNGNPGSPGPIGASGKDGVEHL